jgi:hypothetical protein
LAPSPSPVRPVPGLASCAGGPWPAQAGRYGAPPAPPASG